jgi:hypothetical protein
MPRFRDEILEPAAELNCITRRDMLVFAFDLALRRRQIAVMLLEAVNPETPDEFLTLTSPSPEWFNTIAESWTLKFALLRNLKQLVAAFVTLVPFLFFIHFNL